LNRGRLKTPPAGFGRECEEFRLIELKGEYASFILDLEAEATLLRHILRCVRCHENARRFIEEGYGRGDWLGNLFSRELPDLLGDDIVPGRIGECPKLANYINIDDFIEDRIRWRANRLLEIKSDAEVELNDLRSRIKENETR
jgi:hypothetical protein